MNAIIVTTSNIVAPIDCPSDFSLEWAERIIGCEWIEIVRPEKLPRKFVMLIDEEGKLKPNCINSIGSWLYGTERHGDAIVGDALIVKEDIINGEPSLCGLTQDEAELLATTLGGVM